MRSAKEERDAIVDHFYGVIYKEYLYGDSVQSKGIQYFGRAVEKFWQNKDLGSHLSDGLERTLELGGGSGEHLPFVKEFPSLEYTSLDLRVPKDDTYLKELDPNFRSVIKFVKGDAEKLDFESGYYDRIVITCLLHHVSDPLAVLLEAKRVLRTGGELSIVLPCDPGFLNQLVKRFISYPQLRKLSRVRPELFYALEHRNHISSLIEQVKYVFKDDLLEFHYRPFYLKTWNMNLLVVCHITKLDIEN